ncbi:MAG TPA: AbrB/MazE/SpoVT family DNA-binding domain-containing protein [Gemmatimonadales bacterium]|nr:AbrB/MazE/SpoVT family DNA-binding domain-containing protein [Gemmatimonadales bacterium]
MKDSMRSRISRWGNSLGVRLPKAFVEELGISAGEEVELTVRDGGIVLTKVAREYRLEELVEGITHANRHRETDWGRPKGRELW